MDTNWGPRKQTGYVGPLIESLFSRWANLGPSKKFRVFGPIKLVQTPTHICSQFWNLIFLQCHYPNRETYLKPLTLNRLHLGKLTEPKLVDYCSDQTHFALHKGSEDWREQTWECSTSLDNEIHKRSTDTTITWWLEMLTVIKFLTTVLVNKVNSPESY